MRSRVCAGAALGAAALCAAVLVPEPAYSHKPITTNILFKNEIAQIFQRKCFQCHSENNLAMSLTTYTDARPWARAIREEILDREMPPWQAVPGYGSFANDLSLNTREKEIILSWTDGGAPSGVLKAEESIPPVYVPDAPSWDHGTPDVVLPIGSHTVASGSPFEIKRFVVDTGLRTSARVRAIAFKQGDRRVVRHAAFFEESTGRWIGGWTPWETISRLPGEVSVRLPANARVIVEVGYSGTDQDVTDASELGLYFVERQGHTANSVLVAGRPSRIAPSAEPHRVRVAAPLAADTSALAFWPEPGPGAKSIELVALAPDGMMTPLLWIPTFRSEWRSPYVLSAPLALRRGTRLVMTTYFETSEPLEVNPRVWMLMATTRPDEAPRR
jgi:hypothetical protein